jgi:hypothetical protein
VIPRRAQIKAKDTASNGTKLSSTMLMKRTMNSYGMVAPRNSVQITISGRPTPALIASRPRVELIEHRRPLPF